MPSVQAMAYKGMMHCQFVDANGLKIAYETFGDPDRPAVLLVMGLGTQMIAWPDELCRTIAERGHHVIRFDNRDAGLSTHLNDLAAPSLVDLVLRRRKPPYTIDDMADDAVGLLDALGLDAAHVVGASMGGFIAQTIAIRHPSRVRSLTLFMTSTGSRFVGHPTLAAAKQWFRRRHRIDRHTAIEATVNTFRVIGSRGYALDEEYLRDIAGRSYDRAYDPPGYLRQVAASVRQPNRTRHLRRITVPAVVIHGLDDPLINSSGGRAIARAIPRARLVAFNGMGHDLPRALWPRFADEICDLVRQAETERRDRTESGPEHHLSSAP
jgi:pimeloyl-ACP methyl ester carboxylesterase